MDTLVVFAQLDVDHAPLNQEVLAQRLFVQGQVYIHQCLLGLACF